ncbi:hypothetical protein CSKR_108038 [Clonorchis sinensis]|uniref:Uncharacterized protein n=1 Tax=Clonorchis sinensis TaxID=79923 RepID=A0A3R7H677_CLOSI|nr:hypothetical protein CSKR_108038 [Clonorchis sinensis]
MTSHTLQCLHQAELKSGGPSPGKRVASTNPRSFVISLIPSARSTVAHLSAFATLNWVRKNVRCLAHNVSTCTTHGLTNAASGVGHTSLWKSPLHNQKLAF